MHTLPVQWSEWYYLLNCPVNFIFDSVHHDSIGLDFTFWIPVHSTQVMRLSKGSLPDQPWGDATGWLASDPVLWLLSELPAGTVWWSLNELTVCKDLKSTEWKTIKNLIYWSVLFVYFTYFELKSMKSSYPLGRKQLFDMIQWICNSVFTFDSWLKLLIKAIIFLSLCYMFLCLLFGKNFTSHCVNV